MAHDLKSALVTLQGFNALSEHVIDQLLPFVSIRVIRAGETIFCQGEPSPFCFGVLSGEIVIQHVSKENRFPPKVLGVLGAGSLFGESSIFEDSPRAAMATAGQDGKLAVIRGQSLREWIHKNPDAGQPLLLALLKSTTLRLHSTSHELALVYGVGRLFGSDKGFTEQLASVLEFLKSSLPALDDLAFYRRSAYWEEFSPVMSVPSLLEPAAIPLSHELIAKLSDVGTPQSLDPKASETWLAGLNLPWATRQAIAIIPLFDADNRRDPLQGLLLLASNRDRRAFSAEKQLLLASLAIPLAEALSRCARQEDTQAQERLDQSKKRSPH